MPKEKRKKGVCRECGGETCRTDITRCYGCGTKARTIHPNKDDYKSEWNRIKKYGMELGEFDSLWIVFRGKCGICGIDMKLPSKGRGQALDVVAVDHDHKTGKVRGILCNKCNKGLGFFNDSQELLKEAIKWLSTEKKEH